MQHTASTTTRKQNETQDSSRKRVVIPFRYAEDKSFFFQFQWKPKDVKRADEAKLSPMMKQVLQQLVKSQLKSDSSMKKEAQIPSAVQSRSGSQLFKMNLKFILN